MLFPLPTEIEREIYLKWYFPSVLEELLAKHSYYEKRKKYEVETFEGYIQVYQFKSYLSGHRVICLKPETVNHNNRNMDTSWTLFIT